MATIEDYIRQNIGVPIENMVGGGKPNIPEIPANTKQDLANYWRQNVSTPTDLPQQAPETQQFHQQLEELHQNIDPAILENPPKRFMGLKQKIETQKPINANDIRNTLKPNQPLTPEDEVKLDESRGQDGA